MEFVYVPAGPFTMGSSNDYPGKQPAHQVDLPGYWIGKYEVTVAQYRRFCRKTWRRMPKAPEWGWNDDHPVVWVNWDNARAYCEWAGVRLPTEAEWEKAARGADGWEYPWGDDWDPKRCNNHKTGPNKTMPVDSFPNGASPYGCLDMAGNVAEWCSSLDKPYPYESRDGREDPRASGPRVWRGGSFLLDLPGGFRGASRVGESPWERYDNVGFRCARSS